jgi:hypothetical protein
MAENFLLAWVFVSAADGDTMTVRDGSEHLHVLFRLGRLAWQALLNGIVL